MMYLRQIKEQIQKDLQDKMVLLAGPRQCGKTTLAQGLSTDPPQTKAGYFSWDIEAHRKQLRQQQLPADHPLWIFDEIHKNRHWRNWLKGVYDLHGKQHQILVTGSARLDPYSRGGDSLRGRYFRHHLHPL